MQTNIERTSSIGGFVALPPGQRKWDAPVPPSGFPVYGGFGCAWIWSAHRRGKPVGNPPPICSLVPGSGLGLPTLSARRRRFGTATFDSHHQIFFQGGGSSSGGLLPTFRASSGARYPRDRWDLTRLNSSAKASTRQLCVGSSAISIGHVKTRFRIRCPSVEVRGMTSFLRASDRRGTGG